MKFDKKDFLQKVKNFIIQKHIIITIIIAISGGIFGFVGMVWWNQTSTFCQNCHKNRGTYFSLDMNIPAHKNINKNGKNCLSCHIDKALEHQALRSVKKAPNYLQRVATLNIEDQISSKNIYEDEKCLSCHPEILELVEVNEPNLPLQVKEIGLKFNHKIHHRFKYFLPEDVERWKQLKINDNLSKDEEAELEVLEKIRNGNCEICHSQQKIDQQGNIFTDKTVNYAARNPIGCHGCHVQANPVVHPGNDMEFPKKEICYKCHHGKLHGKFEIFLADCEGGKGQENCTKCHPNYKKQSQQPLVLK